MLFHATEAYDEMARAQCNPLTVESIYVNRLLGKTAPFLHPSGKKWCITSGSSLCPC